MQKVGLALRSIGVLASTAFSNSVAPNLEVQNSRMQYSQIYSTSMKIDPGERVAQNIWSNSTSASESVIAYDIHIGYAGRS